jgi:methyl-accepting chemotaxis protein
MYRQSTTPIADHYGGTFLLSGGTVPQRRNPALSPSHYHGFVPQLGGAVQDINNITSNIAGAVEQQDSATREISVNAQSAAQGNQTLVANIASLRDAIGETDTAAASVLTASDELTSTAETLSREVEKFFCNLRSETAQQRTA